MIVETDPDRRRTETSQAVGRAGGVTVATSGLRRSYGSVVALDDLTFEARAGEVLGLLGPNGAGKTTAIRVLTTILRPTAGSFAVAGIPHSQPGEIRRRIGVLPESAGYPEQQTGDEFLRYHARLFGHTSASARAVAAVRLEEVGLGERASSPIAVYSRGMRQRLGIARALLNEPAVVFFDEPTLGLDPAGQRQVLALLGRIARGRGTTVVLSTHLLNEVEQTCSRVVILNRGRVLADGTVAEVARRAAAPRRGRVRVPPERRGDARAALERMPAVAAVEDAETPTDWLGVALIRGEEAELRMNEALRALADAGIPILAFELEGARLSDAFLAMTGED
jgi:ABC-2 type transport system ATP-binding protein